jgi:hypothetical protein
MIKKTPPVKKYNYLAEIKASIEKIKLVQLELKEVLV